MLIFGNKDNIIYLKDNIDINRLSILNLSSMSEDFERVAIIPPLNINVQESDRFDSEYFNYIFSNDTIFLEFMKIIMALYYGYDVYIIVTQEPSYDYITESLAKLIQCRYGYNSYIVNDPEDILMIGTDIIPEGEFSLPGLAMLDADKERYTYITTSMSMSNNN